MKKTFQIHLRIENDTIESLKRQAHENNISLAEVCRQRLRGNSQLARIELLIENLRKGVKK
jgi:hypothetical protein